MRRRERRGGRDRDAIKEGIYIVGNARLCTVHRMSGLWRGFAEQHLEQENKTEEAGWPHCRFSPVTEVK